MHPVQTRSRTGTYAKLQQFSTKLHKVRPKCHLKFTGFNLDFSSVADKLQLCRLETSSDSVKLQALRHTFVECQGIQEV
jgi:hypothetical protein